MTQAYIVGGSTSQEGIEQELRVISREEEILRELGILHLDSDVTRARCSADETDVTILTKAGVSYVSTTEQDKSESKEVTAQKKKDLKEKMKMKPLNRKEAEILRAAGITWLDNMAVVLDDDTYCHKLGCETNTTATGTVGASTINSTYAERELMRRLKNGWKTVGNDCEECGMQIITKSKGGLLECVICGVVGEDEEENYDPNYVFECYNAEFEHEAYAMESPGVFDVNTNISTITPSLGPEQETFGMETHNDVTYQETINENDEDECNGDEKAHNTDDEAYKEELGLRLFDGWQLTKLNCLSCDLPLITEGEGAPSICLRCD